MEKMLNSVSVLQICSAYTAESNRSAVYTG